jgi:hypothetical protein
MEQMRLEERISADLELYSLASQHIKRELEV